MHQCLKKCKNWVPPYYTYICSLTLNVVHVSAKINYLTFYSGLLHDFMTIPGYITITHLFLFFLFTGKVLI